MGLVKQWMMERHEEDERRAVAERREDARGVFWVRHGRYPNERELREAVDDMELEEAFEEAMSKDD